VDQVTEDVVRIGGLEFRGGEGFEGFYLGSDGIVGWDDSPDIRFDSIDRANRDGEFDVPVYYGARVLTVSGFCYANSSEKLGYYRNRLIGLTQDLTRVDVTQHGVTTFGQGAMAAASKFQVDIPGRRAAYQFSRRFPNPLKYGHENHEQSDANGFAVVSHYGNTDAASRLVVTGSAPSWDVTARGMTVAVSRALQSGQTHVYDLRTGVLTINGSPAPAGSLTQADTWTVPAGDAVGFRLHVGSGNGTLDVYTRDTYI